MCLFSTISYYSCQANTVEDFPHGSVLVARNNPILRGLTHFIELQFCLVTAVYLRFFSPAGNINDSSKDFSSRKLSHFLIKCIQHKPCILITFFYILIKIALNNIPFFLPKNNLKLNNLKFYFKLCNSSFSTPALHCTSSVCVHPFPKAECLMLRERLPSLCHSFISFLGCWWCTSTGLFPFHGLKVTWEGQVWAVIG